MLVPNYDDEIPEMTREVAKVSFPKGTMFIKLRDELGFIFSDELFADLFSNMGQPAQSPGRLAMITIMQFAEGLTDRQTADAVRGRIDWKYALGLELTDSGFHYSVLSEFRQRLVSGDKATLLLDTLLQQCHEKGLLKGKKQQRTDSTHVIAAIRPLNLLELVGETVRKLLNELAIQSPDWLKNHMDGDWAKRYGRRFDSYRLPKTKEAREELACQIGHDGHHLLCLIDQSNLPDLQNIPLLNIMRQIWVQQYYVNDEGIHWRTKKQWGQPPAGQMISSVEDLDAKYCVKRETQWSGYKVHLTETCSDQNPRLITDVQTTAATIHDVKMTETIQNNLIQRDLKPDIHLVDQGYTETNLLVDSQNRGIDLFGPVPSSKSWQDRDDEAFDHTKFHIDWDSMIATCPNGKQSIQCNDRKTWRGSPNLMFAFDAKDCLACDLRPRCSKAKKCGRTLTIYPQIEYEALLEARRRQETDEFKQVYAKRAGIEGTISQGVRKFGMRKARYKGLAKTKLQNIAQAIAINFARLFDWFSDRRPNPTPVSPFVAIAGQL